jgi:hypothetical protein
MDMAFFLAELEYVLITGETTQEAEHTHIILGHDKTTVSLGVYI